MDKRSGLLAVYFPILMATMLAVGVFLGARLDYSDPEVAGPSLFVPRSKNVNKINQIINYIDRSYVDSIDKEALVEDAIDRMLSELDPHSYYISARDLQKFTEPLEGNFEGIGVEFMIQKDTIVIIHPVQGGPSAQLGILAGDRIVEVDGDPIAGVGITNDGVMKMLRGESGSKVTVGIARRGVDDLLDFEITRGKIPLHSVDVAMMDKNSVGYIKVTRFAKTTFNEFKLAANDLLGQGMSKLILDLRNNGGGLMNAAVSIVDEFLEEGKMIVYTEGKSHPRESYYSTDAGALKDVDVVVLINQGSASASEIVAGAVQDNDRGMIIGRRSFGKGLVQHHAPLRDGSALRLTIARYYTPTGRCIQRPYGKGSNYEDGVPDGEVVAENGEVQDTVFQADSVKFITPQGKVVYGGGGIAPDLVVSSDTTRTSIFFAEVSYRGLISRFAFNYADLNRGMLNDYATFDSFNEDFSIDRKTFKDFVDYSADNGVKANMNEAKQSTDEIKFYIKAHIARNIWNNEGFYPIVLQRDRTYQKALEVL